MQRFADGNIAIIGHGSQKVKFSDSQKNEKKKLSNAIKKEMVLSPEIMVPKNLGILTVVNETSNMEKFLRKKYIGDWRWEFSRVRVMMVRFPVMLSM